MVDSSEAVGNRLKILRQSKGIKRKRLSDLSGVSIGTLYLCESGKKIPKQKSLSAIAKTLDVTIGYLVGYRRSSLMSSDDLYILSYQNLSCTDKLKCNAFLDKLLGINRSTNHD